MFEKLKENFSWMKDLAILAGMVALLYLNGHYVTTERFEAYQKANDFAHQAIQTTLISVDKTLALMQRNNEQLVENEKTIQQHTAKVSDLDGRVRAIEYLNIDAFMKESLINRSQLDLRLKTLEAVHPLKAN